MDNNKQKNPQINKCARCGNPCIDFIWTTSRTVHPSIKAMYPDSRICRKCYLEMNIYPKIKLKHTKSFARGRICPVCGKDEWELYRANISNDPVPDQKGDSRQLISSEGCGVGYGMCERICCSVCGYVGGVDD